MTYIFLNPDGTQDFGLHLIIHANTGVVYGHQCAGLANEERTQEGFLIPLSGSTTAKPFIEFFGKEFHGHSSAPQWTPERMNRLRDLISTVISWRTAPKDEGRDDERLRLMLDDSRFADCAEGWVPVRTVYGPATLVFENSD